MSTKLPIGRTHTGSFTGDNAQRQAQVASIKANEHVDAIAVLNNRSYVALATDNTFAAAAYATLLTASITTLLARGFIIVTFSASGVQITNVASDEFQIVVDGVVVKGCYVSNAVNFAFVASMVVRVPVVRGPHTVKLQVKCTANSLRINAKTINEEHAHMLVQEAV